MNDRLEHLEKRVEARCASQEERDQEHAKAQLRLNEDLKAQLELNLTQVSRRIEEVFQHVIEASGVSKLGGQNLSEKMDGVLKRVDQTADESKVQRQSLAERLDKVLQHVDEATGASKLQGHALEESVAKSAEHTRACISGMTHQLGEVIHEVKAQAANVTHKLDDGNSQHKVSLDSLEAAFRDRLAQSEDMLRQLCAKKVEEAAIDAKKAAQRAETAVEALGEGFRSDLEGWGSKLQTRAESLNSAAMRQQAEADSNMQRRMEEAISQAAVQASQQAAVNAVQRAEKVVEALDSNQRTELATAMARITQKVDQLQSAQLRQQQEAEGEVRRRLDDLAGQLGKRDEQANRKFEEHVEQLVRHTEQSVEDVGNGMKKELHTFAKRLNNRFPFM